MKVIQYKFYIHNKYNDTYVFIFIDSFNEVIYINRCANILIDIQIISHLITHVNN